MPYIKAAKRIHDWHQNTFPGFNPIGLGLKDPQLDYVCKIRAYQEIKIALNKTTSIENKDKEHNKHNLKSLKKHNCEIL